MEKFNLKKLGVNYTVLDQDTQETETICVISSEEIRSVVGEYVGTDYTNIGPHIQEVLKGFKGDLGRRSKQVLSYRRVKREKHLVCSYIRKF